jgi:hypothetical protein
VRKAVDDLDEKESIDLVFGTCEEKGVRHSLKCNASRVGRKVYEYPSAEYRNLNNPPAQDYRIELDENAESARIYGESQCEDNQRVTVKATVCKCVEEKRNQECNDRVYLQIISLYFAHTPVAYDQRGNESLFS